MEVIIWLSLNVLRTLELILEMIKTAEMVSYHWVLKNKNE